MNLLKRILISKVIVYHLKKKKKIFHELVEERSSEFRNLEKKLILIIWFVSTKLKKEVCQNPIEKI